jgi:hypothetical protein
MKKRVGLKSDGTQSTFTRFFGGAVVACKMSMPVSQFLVLKLSAVFFHVFVPRRVRRRKGEDRAFLIRQMELVHVCHPRWIRVTNGKADQRRMQKDRTPCASTPTHSGFR